MWFQSNYKSNLRAHLKKKKNWKAMFCTREMEIFQDSHEALIEELIQVLMI